LQPARVLSIEAGAGDVELAIDAARARRRADDPGHSVSVQVLLDGDTGGRPRSRRRFTETCRRRRSATYIRFEGEPGRPIFRAGMRWRPFGERSCRFSGPLTCATQDAAFVAAGVRTAASLIGFVAGKGSDLHHGVSLTVNQVAAL